AFVPSVQTACARPFASVVPLLGVTLPPTGPMDQFTLVPAIGLPYESTTSTTSGCGSGWPTVAVCPSPETRRSAFDGPGAASAENTTGSSPGTAAVTVFCPGVRPSVSRVEARPSASVTDVAGFTDPPPAVTSHWTVIPATPLPWASATFTTSGCASSDPAGAVCSLPDSADTAVGGPASAAAVKTVTAD